ncbi:MAG: hypothetical protein J6K17_08340 [Oscillospiraceae bacterium]|nr:hypothetical protein [Oscillospiraceae bacterium]
MSKTIYKFNELFSKWGLKNIKINLHFAELEFSPTDDDQTAAWDMYVELITRITTQPLAPDEGDEATALESIHAIFQITREILKSKGKNAVNFTKIAIIVLNQIIRPFTAKWHKKKLNNAFQNPTECRSFRKELSELQLELIKYSKLLAELAMVEDLSTLIDPED